MKKFVFTLALAAGVAGAASAQSPVQFGLKGGYYASTHYNWYNSGSDEPDLDSYRPGFTAGAFLSVPLAKRIYLQPELLYAQKGTTLKSYQGNSDLTLKSTVGTVDLPVLVRVGLGKRNQFLLELGPQGSWVARNRDFVEVSDGADTGKNTSPRDLNRVRLGYAAGLGYAFANGLRVGLRSSSDFTPVYREGASRSYAAGALPGANGRNPVVRNQSLQIHLEYAFAGK
jgi:opacity protein-like surface antigen